MIKINTKELTNIIEEKGMKILVDYGFKDNKIKFYYFESNSDSAKLKNFSIAFDSDIEKDLFNKLISGVDHTTYVYKTYVRTKIGSILRAIYDKNEHLEWKVRKGILDAMKKTKNYTYKFFDEYNLFSRMFINNYSVERGKYNGFSINSSSNSFDYIKLQLSVVQCGQTRDEVIEKIKKYNSLLIQYAYDELEKVIGVDEAKNMKLINYIYTRDSCLEYNFVMKDENEVV